MVNADPIVAIATAAGRGGIGVVRVSGADLQPIIDGVLGPAAARLRPRQAVLARFLAQDGHEIDRGIALLFPAPQSFTGETVLELQGHGGPVVLRLLAERCVQAGGAVRARLAEPGEFTLRAFLNHKLDLAQAEAVADLIDASTEAQARGAMRSLAGDFSRRVHALTEGLIELRTLVEATLDFPDEDIDFLQASDAQGRLHRLATALDELLGQAQQGAVLREGLHVVLVGAPNVGKSSLLNALAGQEVAIVTPIAGTTRDRIVHAIAVQGIVLHLIDTAGVRETTDEIEARGIERTLHEVERADVVLHLVDATRTLNGTEDEEVLARLRPRLRPQVPVLTVRNKVDLSGEAASATGAHEGVIRLSARTGAGLEALREALLQAAGWSQRTSGDTVVLARERHLAALRQAQTHLQAAARVLQDGLGAAALELFAEELRLGGQALASITGEVSADDLLGHIFSRFCIGK